MYYLHKVLLYKTADKLNNNKAPKRTAILLTQRERALLMSGSLHSRGDDESEHDDDVSIVPGECRDVVVVQMIGR